ncbi:WD domain containing protein [Euroglyphus maynei]|uniref:WD domain containing protein n=1 Tax=Euroglyphus maynei TaxID=6958 RepID=A0A1Y3AZM1_EURMA|nr:WD domain containing protein [Euroglyphus maynei]
MEEFIGLSTDESFISNNSSLSIVGGGDGINCDRSNMNTVFIRFAELEKKLSDQSDEIVCLKSTLADVLRRLNQLEGRAIVTTSYHHLSPASHHHHQNNSNGKNVYNNRGNIFTGKIYGKNLSSLSNGNATNLQNNNEQITSPLYPSNNRRYLSSTSLQYDTTTTPISSPQMNNNYRSISSMNHSKSLMRMNSGSNLKSMKRWSASQDIRFSSIDPNIKKNIFGSVYNLHALKNTINTNNQNNNNNNNRRSGNLKDFYYNQVEGVIKFNICDRQIIINIPTDLLQTYTIKNVTSPPLQRLKLEWA